jgi:GTPase SAR1 family protein
MLRQTPVLLVAGPSGAGKSTLIYLLQRNKLPDEVHSELPRDVASWPLLQGKHLRKLGRSGVETLSPHLSRGFVAHYDTSDIKRAGFDQYNQDPAAAFFRNFTSLVILSIKPDAERLRAQLADRNAMRQGSRNRLHDLWVRHVREPFKRAANKLTGRDTSRRVVVFYDDPSLVARYAEAWESYMHSLIEEKPRARILRIEPHPAVDGSPSFRVIDLVEA